MHPLRIGGLYGVLAAVVYVATIYFNRTANPTHPNALVGLIGSFLLPLVAVYLSGHLSGRRERLNIGTTLTSGARATFHGTGAGVTTGLVFVIASVLISALLLKVAPGTFAVLGKNAFTGGASFLNGVFTIFNNIGGAIGWVVLGLLTGTVGGALGDNLAHKQLKSAAATKAPAVAK